MRFSTKEVRRIAIKIGSSSIVDKSGEVRLGFLGELATITARAVKAGREVVLISSGAIAMGFTRLGFKQRPKDIPSRQACAAAGQTELMALYQTLLETQGVKAAQVLLTREDMEQRQRYLNAKEAIHRLLTLSLVPVINENDSVAVEEIQYGDNDLLSSLVAIGIGADLLVMLTDVEGVYAEASENAESSAVIETLTPSDVEKLSITHAKANVLGSGGIQSKLLAAKLANSYGVPVVIAKAEGERLTRVLDGFAEGSFSPADKPTHTGKKRWLASAAGVMGTLVIDDGAAKALREKGKSLLPKGLVETKGAFLRGASVAIVSEKGEDVGKGIVRYSSGDLKKIQGRYGNEIESILSYTYGDEIVHRDDFVLTQNA